MERLQKQMKFILEVDKVKEIFRQTYLSDGSRKENDAEHSWHLALMAVLLKEYANEEVDLLKVIPMVLIHDLVILMPMIRQDLLRREKEKQRQQTGFLVCFHQIRQKFTALCGKSLKRMRLQKQSLLMHWITVSHCS